MPQFDFANVFIPQLFWLAILFAILYFGVVRLTLPKVGAIMEARETKVSSDIDAAEKAGTESENLNEGYQNDLNEARENARTILADAKAKSTASVEKKLANASKKADEAIAAAQTDIETARVKAMAEIETVAAEGAGAIVERLTGNAPSTTVVNKAAKAAFN